MCYKGDLFLTTDVAALAYTYASTIMETKWNKNINPVVNLIWGFYDGNKSRALQFQERSDKSEVWAKILDIVQSFQWKWTSTHQWRYTESKQYNKYSS